MRTSVGFAGLRGIKDNFGPAGRLRLEDFDRTADKIQDKSLDTFNQSIREHEWHVGENNGGKKCAKTLHQNPDLYIEKWRDWFKAQKKGRMAQPLERLSYAVG